MWYYKKAIEVYIFVLLQITGCFINAYILRPQKPPPTTTVSSTMRQLDMSNYTNFEKFYKTTIFDNRILPKYNYKYQRKNAQLLTNNNQIAIENDDKIDSTMLRLYGIIHFDSTIPILSSDQLLAVRSN